jgi:hypothetical protein
MAVAYLWLNSALYFIFAVLCTLRVDKVTQAQGFLSLDANGRCEYLTVYGGMEMGFAAFFAACALKSEYRGAGILFALCMYAGIVAYRTVCLVTFSDISVTTKSIAGLEIVLLICAALLFAKVVE